MSHTIFACSKRYLHNKKRRPSKEHRCGAGQIPSEGQVRNILPTLESQRGVNYAYLFSKGLLGFYSKVDPNTQTCIISLFLMGKIFINVHIFQNPSFVGVLFAVGLYGLGLIVRLKLFPFRIPWRPHNYQLSAMWPFGLFTLGLSTMDPSTIGSIVEQSVILNESVHLVSLNSLCMFDRFCLCRQVR